MDVFCANDRFFCVNIRFEFREKKSKKSMPFQKISTLDELNPRELNPYDLNKKFIRV